MGTFVARRSGTGPLPVVMLSVHLLRALDCPPIVSAPVHVDSRVPGIGQRGHRGRSGQRTEDSRDAIAEA
jgi:hypothetical protein